MHPENPDILLAAAGNDPYSWPTGHPLGGIYLTEDGGDNWTEVLDGHDFSVVEFCENDPNVAYAASVSGFYRSDDGGHIWQEMAGGNWGPPDIIAGFPIDMQCDPRDANRIFVNSYGGGNFLSENGGAIWTVSSNGYTGALMSQVAVVQDDAAHVFASARSGVFVSQNGGETWAGLSYGVARQMEGLTIVVDPQDSTHLLATIGDSGPNPLASRDGGQTWHIVDTGLWAPDQPPSHDIVTQIVFAPSDPQLVLATVSRSGCWDSNECDDPPARGVIISRDGGDTWTRTGLSDGTVLDLAFAPADTSRVYAAVYPGDVYRSDDSGQTWQLVAQNLSSGIALQDPDPDLPAPALTALAVDPQNPDKLYGGFFRGAMAISQDGGATWQASSAGMSPETSVRDIVADTANPGVVYAAAPDSGVFVSQDGGQTWAALNEGLLTRAAKSLALSADGSVLYLATEGGGVFRLGTPPESLQEPTVQQSETELPQPSEAPPGDDSNQPPAPSAPESEPSGGGGLCGGAATWPLVLLGLVWMRRRP